MIKKGDIPSLIYVVVSIFVIGVLFLVTSHMTDKFEDKLDDYLESSPKYNNSVALDSLRELNEVEQSVWDYSFLAILFGLIIAMLMTAYATRISAAFFWIYAVMTLIILILGVVTSNMWQEIAVNPELSETVARFPITDALLGTKFPIVVTAIILIMIILLFGKSPEQSGAGAFG